MQHKYVDTWFGLIVFFAKSHFKNIYIFDLGPLWSTIHDVI